VEVVRNCIKRRLCETWDRGLQLRQRRTALLKPSWSALFEAATFANALPATPGATIPEVVLKLAHIRRIEEESFVKDALQLIRENPHAAANDGLLGYGIGDADSRQNQESVQIPECVVKPRMDRAVVRLVRVMIQLLKRPFSRE
jgi:hypothetical protein